MDDSWAGKRLDVLDYGGGGGQFALVCRSHLPLSKVHITDVSDEALLDEWRPMNVQIKFDDFASDPRRFDAIFLNDVFEHLYDPGGVLLGLAGKLKPGGRIFIDTPKQFWIYPVTRAILPSVYEKVLRGTVSDAHVQIWSRRAFELVVSKAGMVIEKYRELSEYTMDAGFYLRNMGINSPLLLLAGQLFYRNAQLLAKNKIMAVLVAREAARSQ